MKRLYVNVTIPVVLDVPDDYAVNRRTSVKKVYRVEVVVYEIDVQDEATLPDGRGGFEHDEAVQDVPFEEVVWETEDGHKAQMFATALWKGAKK